MSNGGDGISFSREKRASPKKRLTLLNDKALPERHISSLRIFLGDQRRIRAPQ